MGIDSGNFAKIDNKRVLSQIVRAKITLWIHRFFDERGFLFVEPPVLHERVDNKKQEIYLPLHQDRYSLNSSNALYLGAYASFFGKVYAISPTFRDEEYTMNHLVEFRMLEVEAVNMEYGNLIPFVDSLFLFILRTITADESLRNYDSAIVERAAFLAETYHPLIKTYEEVLTELYHRNVCSLTAQTDISTMDYHVSEYIDAPLYITNYKFASWTAKRPAVDVVNAFNLILPGSYGELCEACERDNDVNLLRDKFQCAGITHLDWYVDSISKIHSARCGFGIGLERLLRWILGLPSIEESLFFPRTGINSDH